MPATLPVLLGVDAGTTSVKTVAFGPDGGILALHRVGLEVLRGPDLRSETSMEDVFAAAATTISVVASSLPANAVIEAIGVTGQGDGAWLLDQHHQPVGPAILWSDGRATERLDTWREDGRDAAVAAATRTPALPGALPLLLDELSEAGMLDNAAHHLNCKDYIRFRLTGSMATDPSEASRTYLDVTSGGYSDALIDRLGHERYREWLAPVLAPTAVGGRVSETMAQQLGLRPGIPVSVGMVDTADASVGLGATAEGDAYAILGTTGLVGIHHASAADIRQESSIVLALGRGGAVLETLAPMSGTPNLDWARGALGFDQDWKTVEREAAGVPAGSSGILYLPYGSPNGERAPFVDSAASASWLGMNITTTPAELLRSVYEGLAYALTECMDALSIQGSLTLCGGGSDSDLFCSILADASGRTILRQTAPEVGARGAAVLAAVAAGVHPDEDAAVTALVPDSETFEPDPARAGLYSQAYATYLSTRDALRPHWPALRSLRSASR